jgi:release factor glutamine methyltransferase
MFAAMTSTVGEALRAAVARLAERGHPASDAEELLSRLLGIERGPLHYARKRELGPETEKRFAEYLERRLAGEPVQYITGRAAFRDLDLMVDRRVLIPRPETELLVDVVLDYLHEHTYEWRLPSVLELGTGSGCIALSIAHEESEVVVLGTDVSEDALAVARANAVALGLTARAHFLQSDWFEQIKRGERYDVIVANPPYISPAEAAELPADVREWEPHAALFASEDGLADLREIVDEAPRHLRAGGLLALELAEMRAREVAGWLDGARDWHSVELRKDLARRPRMLLAIREHGPAIAPAQWREEG